MGDSFSKCKPNSNKYGPKTIPIERSFFHLLQAGRSEDCISALRGYRNLDYSKPINANGDNLLHYACGVNNL